MEENRDEILANFQSITALDVGEAILYLEEANWDLLTAIQRAIPQEDDSLGSGPSSQAAAVTQPALVPPMAAVPPLSRKFNNLAGGSSSSSSSSSSRNHRSTNNNTNSNNNGSEDVSMAGGSSAGYNIPAVAAAHNPPPRHSSRMGKGTSNSSSSTSNNNNNNNNGQSTSSSSTSARDYTFTIHYNGTQHRIRLSGQSTVNDLKGRIAEKAGVVACRQALGGWPTHSKRDAQIGTSTLRSLSLARETDLNLTDLSTEGFVIPPAHELDVVARLNSTFTLNILLEPEGRVIPLKMPGVTTYLDVKNSVFAVTNVATRHQAWTGWPRNVADSTTLAQSGVGLEHNFTLKSSFMNSISLDDEEEDEDGDAVVVANGDIDHVEIDDDDEEDDEEEGGNDDDDDFEMRPSGGGIFGTRSGGRRPGARSRGFNVGGFGRGTNMDVFEVDDSEDEIENASDDDLLEDISNMHRSTALMTDNVSDELSGCVMFSDNYQQRYGDAHPQFYTGTLADAIAEATQKPAKDRKLLALYLHHDRSVLTNVFCSQLLGYETIIAELNSNFIVYGWDLTYETNKNMLLSSITSSIGTTASMTVREISVDQLPAMIVVAKLRSSCEVYSVIYGNLGVNDLMVQLLELVERYAEQKSVESRDERERAEREEMLMEQDAAYEVSLRADQVKAEERLRKEQLEASEKHRVETEKAELEAKREASRLAAERTLPVEPAADYAGALIKIRVRQPNGQSAERRFMTDTKLDILLNYVASIGFPKDEYKMFSGWPRKDLTTMDLDSTLQDLRMCAQETLILEER